MQPQTTVTRQVKQFYMQHTCIAFTNLFCSLVAKNVACFCCLFDCSLKDVLFWND